MSTPMLFSWFYKIDSLCNFVKENIWFSKNGFFSNYGWRGYFSIRPFSLIFTPSALLFIHERHLYQYTTHHFVLCSNEHWSKTLFTHFYSISAYLFTKHIHIKLPFCLDLFASSGIHDHLPGVVDVLQRLHANFLKVLPAAESPFACKRG